MVTSRERIERDADAVLVLRPPAARPPNAS